MDHLQIAYYLSVILVGIAVLAIAGFWALKTKEAYLLNFWMVYASFTIILIIAVLKNYLSLNVANYSAWSWYFISGIHNIVSFAVLIAALHFFLDLYQIRYRKAIVFSSLFIALVCIILLFSPLGTTLDEKKSTIHFTVGYKISSIYYFILFSLLLIVGYSFIRRIWNTDKRYFVLGLLLFATIGYGETLSGLSQNLCVTAIVQRKEFGFLISSIPYAIYGFFLIYYFSHFRLPVIIQSESLSEEFLAKHKITERESEVIQRIVLGKSNADIATELFISLATVKTHLHNIYKKAGVNSRYDLLARVRSNQ